MPNRLLPCFIKPKCASEHALIRFGDLSVEVDKRVKKTVANFCGKDEYTPGDLSREVASRVSTRVAEFTGKEGYQFGDISKEIEKRRVAWVKDVLGKDDYQFGGVRCSCGDRSA